MNLLKFDQADADQMKAVQRAITAAVMPYRENTEAALVIMALLRCARILLRLYPKKFQDQFTPVLTDFLENAEAPPTRDGASPLWMPES